MGMLQEKIKDGFRPYKWSYRILQHMLQNQETVYLTPEYMYKDFHDYYINTPDFFQKMEALLHNFTDEEKQYIKSLFAVALSTFPNKKMYTSSVSELEPIKIELNSKIKKEQSYFKWKNYKLPINFFSSEIFYKEMGIKHLNTEKLKNKDFIDAGAYIGDSALVLRQYMPQKIYAFEPIGKNYNLLCQTIKLNNANNIIPVNEALSSEIKEDRIYFCNDLTGSSLISNNFSPEFAQSETIKINYLDNFVEENHINVGLIKMDIEGAEYDAIMGAYNTICKFKPALLISIYHTAKDFFEIKPLIESWNLGYKFKIVNTGRCLIQDTMLIAEVG